LTHSVYLRWINPTNCGLQTAGALVRYSASDYRRPQTKARWFIRVPIRFASTRPGPGQPYYYTIWVSNDGTNWLEPPE
jgi:hypothetical protein